MRLLPALLLALLLPAAARAGAPFPGGLLDSTGRTAYLTVGDGLAAVDLAAGDVRWRTTEASQPLLVAGDRLFALAGSRAGRLFVRGFNLTEHGQRVFESEPIELPRWAVPENGPGRSFAFAWKRDKSKLSLSWQVAAWAEGSPRKEAAGTASVDLTDGKVRQADAAVPGGPAVRVPAFLEKLSVRWLASDGGQARAVVSEESAGSSAFQRRQQLVLRRWDERTGKELPPRELLRGRDLSVLPDADGKHLWLRDGMTSSEVEAKAAREWVVVSSLDGKDAARVPHVPGTLAATVHERRAYCVTVSAVRAEPGKPTRRGRALVAVDLTTGKVAWRLPLTPAGQQ